MSITDYRNFDLLITRSGDRYRAFVVDAPGGDASTTFDLPFTSEELVWLDGLTGIRRGIGGDERRAIGGGDSPPKMANLSDLGQRLFQAIFRDDVAAVLTASLTTTAQERTGLRLRLRFEQDAANLATLPWEILYDPTHQHFLALGEDSPVLRYLSLPRSRSALLVKPPLRVLAVLSSPSDLRALDMDREWQAVQQALAELVEASTFVLERLEHPSLAALQARLLGEPVHVLHFIGHGIFDEASGAGNLVLEDTQGKADLVKGEQLATVLRNHTHLRLVYLNACEGALASGQSVFTGVAQVLVKEGVPAAVAMQAEITDSGAIELARTFYTALAAGRPVDAALSQARVALAAGKSDEWAIPVLFSRSPDNHLFDIREALPTPECPYPGMTPFTEAQQDLFFGRDREIGDAVERLRQHPFLAVIGPSGSGKSSLVYAGIIPALRKSRRFGLGAWTVLTMRPGQHPRTLLADLLPEPVEGRTLIFVDQFEELFTQADGGEAQGFLDALKSLMGRPNLFILLTVRADFYPDLMASAMWKSIQANRLELPPLGDDELWAAIVEPAAQVGVTVDEALAVQLIADAAGQSGVLPLVQETLLLLWEKVERRELKLAAYRQMAEDGRSGIQVAINRRADIVYNNLPQEGKPVARRIFLRLVQFGEGRADTRRQQTVADLRASGDNSNLFDTTLSTLTDNRLLTTSGESDSPTRQVDISHEALIIGWAQLQRWITEKREAEATRRKLEDAAQSWIASDKQSGLLDEYELHEAGAWLAMAEAEELGVSRALIDLVKVSKEAHRQSKRRRRLLFVIGSALVLSIIVLGVYSMVSRSQEELARDSAARQSTMVEATFELSRNEDRMAQLKSLHAIYPPDAVSNIPAQVAFSMRNLLEEDPILFRKNIEVRIEKIAWSPDGYSIFIGGDEGTGQIWSIFSPDTTAMPGRLRGRVTAAAWNGDSSRVLIGSDGGTAALWDLKDGSYSTLAAQMGAIKTVGWSLNGLLVATAGEDGILRIWDGDSGKQVTELAGDETPIRALAWISDTQIAIGGETGVVRIWDVLLQSKVGEIDSELTMINSLAWHPETHQMLLLGGDVQIWDLTTNQKVGDLTRSDMYAENGKWYPDGTGIILFGGWGQVLTWRASVGATTSQVLSDGTIRFISHPGMLVWDPINIIVHRPDYGWEHSLTFDLSPSGKEFAIGGWDGTLALWNIGNETTRSFQGHFSVTSRVQWHPDGQHFLTVDEMGTVRIWNLKSSEPLFVAEPFGFSNPYATVRWSPTGNQMLAPITVFMCWEGDGSCSGEEQRLKFKDASAIPTECDVETSMNCLAVWDWFEDRLVAAMPVDGEVWQTVWSPNEQEILVGVPFNVNPGGTVDETPSQLLLWDITSNTIRIIRESKSGIRALSYAPGGDKALAAYADGTLLALNVKNDSWSPLEHPLADKISAAILLDDEQILLGGGEGSVWLWNGRTWAKIVDGREHLGVEVTSIAKRPDGPEILTTSRDGTTRVFRTDSWVLSDLFFNPDSDPNGSQNEVFSGSWSSTGGHILNGTFDRMARLWIGREALAARLTERVCSTMEEDEIEAEIVNWRGCEVEMAAVEESLIEYRRLVGR